MPTTEQLAEDCRTRAAALQHETLAEIVKRNLTDSSRGNIHAVKQEPDNQEDDVPPPPPLPPLAHDVPVWAQPLIAAVTQRPQRKPRKEDSICRNLDRKPNDRDRRRTSSPGRNLVVGRSNKCSHCGSDQHTRKDCSSFENMMCDANVGKPKETWKQPTGYKSAMAKARDAQKVKDSKDKKKINAVMQARVR